MVDLLSEVEYGRILGSFTAVAEDFGDTVAPDAIPLAGKVVFSPSISHVTYINSDGETASLYLHPVTASIVDGRLVGSEGNDGVVLLASNSNNVSASVLWTASISIDPIGPGQEAPEVYTFLIEVARNEISSLIDVIKANSRVHNVALFHDAIAEAAAKFWERVEAGEFRGNQGPPGPAGVGVGVPGPIGRPGIIGKDGDPGVGGNLLPDGDLEEPGFLVTGDYQETSDAASGSKAVTLTHATSRKIRLEPETSYVGTVYLKSPEASTATITMRVFGSEGDIDRVIENAYDLPADSWRRVTFLLDSNLGDQSMEIITASDGRTISADLYTLSDNSVVQGLQRDLTAAQEQLEAAMAQLDLDLAHVDAERIRLNDSLNDLAVVLEDADIDLTALNADMAELNENLVAEETRRQEADAAAQLLLDQLDTNLTQAKNDLASNQIILDNLGTELETSKSELDAVAQNITDLETITLPALEKTLKDADAAASQELSALNDKLYGASGDVTTAKANIAQLATDLTTEAQAREQLALDIAEDFTERDSRLATAEQALDTAFPNGPLNVEAELAETIHRSVVEYAVSSSETVPPTVGWSDASPSRNPGEFIWFRTVITYGDGTEAISGSALMTGNSGAPGEQGIPGVPGEDGTSVTILGTKDSVSELPTSGTAGDAYLVDGYLYVWSGSWQNVGLIRGPQGIPGTPGEDGQPTYTWIKYADTSTGLGISDDPAGKRYIGLAFNKPSSVESSNTGDYQWALFEGPEGPAGDPGEKGDPGDPGAKGDQGVGITAITPYFRDVARGAAAPAKPTTLTPSGWSVTEPAWLPDRDLYRVEKVTYTTGDFAYTSVTKIAAYAGIDAAMAAANGKNLNTYTDLAVSSKPGPAPAPDSARTVGDIHRNRDSSTGEVWAEYQWTGSAWQSVSFGDGVLSSLDVGKVTGGTGAFQQFFADKLIADDATITKLWADQLSAKTAAFNRLTVAPTNLIPDPNNTDPDIRAWRSISGSGPTWNADEGYWSLTSPAAYNTIRTEGSSNTRTKSSDIVPGQRYVLSFDVWMDAGTSQGARFAPAYLKTDGTTAYVGDEVESGGDISGYTGFPAGQWTTITRYWDAPSDAVSASFDLQVNGVSGAGEIRIKNPVVRPAVGAVLIEDGAVSADKIQAESVAGAVGKFINLETSQLVATDNIKTPEAVIDKLWAETMSTKKVYAENIVVSSGNLITDRSKFGDITPNTEGVGRLSVISSATYGKRLYLALPASAQTWTYGVWFNAPKQASGDFYIDVQPSTEYRFSFGASAGGNMGGAMPTVRIVLYCYDVSGAYLAGRVGTIQPLTWDRSEWSVTTVLPDNCVYVRPCLSYEKVATTGDYTGGIMVYDPSLIATVGAVQISDGAVNASKINAESVGAAVGEFVKLDVKNLTAGSANINSLVAQKIAAGTAAFQTVNADHIISSTGTMDSAVINQIWADGIAARSLTAGSATIAPSNMLPWRPRRGSTDVTPHINWGVGTASWGFDVNTGEMLDINVPEQSDPTATNIVFAMGAAVESSFPIDGNYPNGIPVQAGTRYRLDFGLALGGNYSQGYPEVSVQMNFYAKDGTRRYSETVPLTDASGSSTPDHSGKRMTGEFTVAEGTNEAVNALIFLRMTSSGHLYVYQPSMVPMVGAVLIEDGAVSANHLTSNSVDTDHLRANAVSAEKIVAGAITTEKMTANTIDGDRIRANTLHADKILANTITATKIASKTISAEEIKARTILADNIVAGTITGNEIKARSIKAAEIAAGTITANELDVVNITANAGFIDNLWTKGIQAKTIAASRLIVGSGNTYWNQDFEDQAGHGSRWDLGGGKNGGNSVVIESGTVQRGSYDLAGERYSERTIVSPGQAYAIGAWVRLSDDSAANANNISLYVRTYTETNNGATFTDIISVKPSFAFSANIWYWVEGVVSMPDDCTRIAVGFYAESGYAGSARFSNPSVRIATSATTIEGGAISTGHMSANSIDGDRIRAGTLSADKIISGTIETRHMTANSISGDRIKAGTLTADKIIGGSFEGKTFTGGTFTGGKFIGPNMHLVDGANDGMVLTSRSAYNNSVLYYARNGDLGPDSAAIWRSDYSTSRTPLEMRGANGSGVRIHNGLLVSPGIIEAGDAVLGGVAFSSGKIANYAGELWVEGDGTELRLRNDGSPQVASQAIYDRSYSSSANVVVTSFGTLGRSTSSRRYKKNIADWNPEAERVLALRPRQWQHDDPEHNPEIDETWQVGFIAEEVSDLGLRGLVDYAGDGAGGWRPESLRYDRFAAAHQIVLRKHEDEIKELRAEINELRSGCDRIKRNHRKE